MAEWRKVIVESSADNIAENAATATALATARDFSITGEVTASAVSFDGTGNVALSATVANDIIDEANLKVTNAPTDNYILSYDDASSGFTWVANTASANDATITLAAGTGLSGGGDFTTNQSGAETIPFNLDLQEAQEAVVDVAADYFVFLDGGATGTTRKESIADLVSGVTGANLASQNGVLKLTPNPDIEGTLDVTGVATFDNNVIVTGDLTVNGSTTTLDTTNLLVEDTFISLNSGGTTNVDAGIVFTGLANKVFGWDQSQESGRFGVDYAGGDASVAGGGFSPDAWVSTVHTAAGDDANATASLEQIGNLYINSSNSDIYIWA